MYYEKIEEICEDFSIDIPEYVKEQIQRAKAKKEIAKANIHYEKGEYKEANDLYEKNKSRIKNKNVKFMSYVSTAHTLYKQEVQYEIIASVLEKALKIKPEDFCKILLAKTYIHLKNYEAVIDTLQFIEQTPEIKKLKALAHNEIGKKYYEKTNYAQAKENFEKAKQYSAQPIYYNNYACALLETAAYDEAKENFKKAQQPHHEAIAWNQKGNVHMQQKVYQTAKQCYEKAIQLHKENILYQSNLGYALCKLKNYTEAAKQFNQVLEQTENQDMRALEGIEKVYIKQLKGAFNKQEALIYYEKLSALFPKDATYLYQISNHLFDLNDISKSVDYIKKAIKIDKNYKVAIDFFVEQLNGNINDLFDN